MTLDPTWHQHTIRDQHLPGHRPWLPSPCHTWGGWPIPDLASVYFTENGWKIPAASSLSRNTAGAPPSLLSKQCLLDRWAPANAFHNTLYVLWFLLLKYRLRYCLLVIFSVARMRLSQRLSLESVCHLNSRQCAISLVLHHLEFV